MGQQLDLMSPKCELKNFDMTLYSQIVQYKTSYYSFYLPVQLGMILAGVQNPELYRQARTILLAMGHLFQVQDDFIDCYGDPNVTGKIGTDIQDRKCSWLIVQALHNANENQRQVLHVSLTVISLQGRSLTMGREGPGLNSFLDQSSLFAPRHCNRRRH